MQCLPKIAVMLLQKLHYSVQIFLDMTAESTYWYSQMFCVQIHQLHFVIRDFFSICKITKCITICSHNCCIQQTIQNKKRKNQHWDSRNLHQQCCCHLRNIEDLTYSIYSMYDLDPDSGTLDLDAESDHC